ncbi:MAG: ASCH domain-containing protein [Candidatus Shapirobacteria bacterium]|jgi:hypothetical protein
MDHVAIMNRQAGLIDHILSGQKTIETRWYQNRITPYGRIAMGDIIYFKNSGGLIRAKALVSQVSQYAQLTIDKCQQIIDQYGAPGLIDIQNSRAASWAAGKNYAILIWLKDPVAIIPFNIDKRGFGSSAAWLTLPNIDTIKKS